MGREYVYRTTGRAPADLLMNFFTARLLLILMVFFLFLPHAFSREEAEEDETVFFEIRNFMVEGNSLFTEKRIKDALKEYTGTDKTAEDVENAREKLENLYHQQGYPTVLVSIPLQTVERKVVKLKVVESRIDRVRVQGNRFFTRKKILGDLPSLSPGAIIYLPDLRQELARINRNPDLKVSPLLMPGSDMGTVDVALQVKDFLPLHGSLELNNRSTHDTTNLRLNAMLRYDNLWQKGHSLSLQYQTAPKDVQEVEVMAASYVMPAPWSKDQVLVGYGVWSDSDTAFGEGFNVIGKGNIFGLRLVAPLPAYELYSHNITLGLDYKDLDEDVGFEDGSESMKTPIKYLPFSFAYNSSIPDKGGITCFSAGLHMVFRGLVSRQKEFEIKRYQALGNYIYLTAGFERNQRLPLDFNFYVKADFQITDQPLIANEQYVAGGMESVRGYKENEVSGDDAAHITCELSGPDLTGILSNGFSFAGKVNLIPYIFYDGAGLRLKKPLPGEDRNFSIQGAGAGVRGKITQHIEFRCDWAVALTDTDRTDSRDAQLYFRLKSKF